ncbi:MAG TPA: NUDIX hydrolase [Planctomycetota bacterium]|nr:NUDIX hydrolase [Planctomycetota bacterium]
MKDRLSRRTVWTGRMLAVHEDRVRLPDGREIELEFIHHPGAAAVLPLHEDGSLTLLRQYRYAVGGTLLEMPAGKLDPGESPEACAARELQEEAGLKPGLLVPLAVIHTTPGFTDERIHLYAATALTEVPQALEEDELLELVRLPLAEALDLAASGGITDAKTLCALMRLEQELAAGRLSPASR